MSDGSGPEPEGVEAEGASGREGSAGTPPPSGGRRRRDVTLHPSLDDRNALWHWWRVVGFWKTVRNYVLMTLARASPSLRLKSWLYRRMGATVGRHVSVGLDVTLDIFFPELITLEDDIIVGYDTVILCHEFTHDDYRTGPVRIARGATVGARCTILPGVTIGEGATVSAMSLVNRDVPAGEFWGGVPARPLARAGQPRDPAGSGGS